MKQLVKRTETTRYLLKPAITRTLLVKVPYPPSTTSKNDGSRVGVGSTTTEVEFRNAQTKTQTGIKNVNSGAGTFTVTVDQAPQGRRIKNIRVAAWSQAHQENLFWYSTAPSGMHTEVQVSAANHQYQSGNYTTHVYVDYVDGGVEGFLTLVKQPFIPVRL